MALEKELILPNGIGMGYHRVAAMHVYVNVQNDIEVQSYISKEKREEEQAAIPEGLAHDVYVTSKIYTIPYDPDMSVMKAYDYLKGLEEFSGADDVIDAWTVGASYFADDMVVYEDETYVCIQAHTSQEGWEPPSVPALWRVQSSGGDIPVWVQPDSASPYMAGDKVRYPDADGPIYESLIDNNVWSPEAYPQGWQLVEGGE